MEQVFHEMGIGSVATLHDFYQTRVLKYHDNMMKMCKHLVAQYDKLKQPIAAKSPSTSTVTQKDVFNVIRSVRIPSSGQCELLHPISVSQLAVNYTTCRKICLPHLKNIMSRKGIMQL